MYLASINIRYTIDSGVVIHSTYNSELTFQSHVLKWAGLVAVRNKQTQFASYVHISCRYRPLSCHRNTVLCHKSWIAMVKPFILATYHHTSGLWPCETSRVVSMLSLVSIPRQVQC